MNSRKYLNGSFIWVLTPSSLTSKGSGNNLSPQLSNLAQWIVADETLDKTEKIYAEIDGFLIEIH